MRAISIHRRSFVSGAVAFVAAGSLARVIGSASPALARASFHGYGDLIWTGHDGCVWFVSSYGSGPDVEEGDSGSAAAHAGQIWRFDPARDTLELVTIFPVGSPYDGPDNITAGPHGFAIACTDGDADQWLVAISDDGKVFPFAFNAYNDSEFAGATFSPSGQTLS